jgi:uncharacterized membrane protein YbaN (DUF454 family)
MTRQTPSKTARVLFGLLAYVSLGIGLVAIVIPGLPTTEFILLAAWAATRSSPRLSAWLENHRLFGPMLSNWRNGKVITRRSKISATVSMLLCAVVMYFTLPLAWPVYASVGGMVLVNLWIWSRPELSAATPDQHAKTES